MLKHAQPAETLYFYQVYLVEFKMLNSKEQIIAKKCTETDTPCIYAEFLEYISDSVKYKKVLGNKQLMAIIEAVDGTDVITTSRKLQEKGFEVEYNLSKLLEGTRKISLFALVFKTIDDKIRERLGFDKVAEHRKPLADALDLIQKHRIADSMPYFTEKLQKELGIDFVNQSPDLKTPDSFLYAAYDTEGTVNKLKDSVKNETDPEKKANILAQADGLAARTKELVTKMRSPEYQKEVTNDRDLKMFRNHQAVIYQAKETLRKLKKLEKSGKC